MRPHARLKTDALIRHALISIVIGFVVLGGPGSTAGHAQTAISDAVYQTIRARMVLDQGSFYIYLDQDAGQNHGFPSGRFASSTANLATLHVDAGCIDDSFAASGCSSDPSALDRTRGTVMRIRFDPQTAGNFAGLNIEEPENWGVLQTGAGYDAQGASAIVVDVRSPDNATVRFAVGGCETAPTTIGATWETRTIPFESLSCAPDLSNLHLLFAVTTNDALSPSGATVLIDNLQFDPLPASRSFLPVAFPAANETFGVVPRQNAPIPPDQALRNLTTTYESSLTALALFARGTPQDGVDAGQIADSLHYALAHDNTGNPLPGGPGGSTALHNGYESGDLALHNGQQPPGLAQAGDSRLPGFTAAALCPGGACVLLDGATGGNNAFAIVALISVAERFHSDLYLDDARTIGRWIVGNLKDTSGTAYGGYFIGYPDNSSVQPKPRLTGKSTENNADIFAAMIALSAAEERRGRTSDAVAWTAAATAAGDFVIQMFDAAAGRFNVGTVPVGTAAAAGICPNGDSRGTDVINTCDFLDAQTFPVLAMAGSSLYRTMIDWKRPINYAVANFGKSVTAGGRTFTGFSLVPSPVAGPDGVAWEFTAQVVAAMRYVDRLTGSTTFESAAAFYLDQLALAQSAAPFGDGSGIVAATLQNGDALPPSDQCLQTPFQCIAERVGLAASTWAAFAEQQVNIFAPGSLIPAVRVTAPNAPALWAAGTPRLITWAHNLGVYGMFDIEVSRNGGASWELIDSVVTPGEPSSGSYLWTVTEPNTANARIRVSATNGAASDSSDAAFAIVNPVVTVTAPNGAGMLLAGATYTITFTHNLGAGQPVDLEVSGDGGQIWDPITTVTTVSPVSGSFPWVVSAASTTEARIRASWANDRSVNDSSDVNFSIAGPTITVTSPNGAGNIQIGTTRSITFTHNLGAGKLMNIDISRDSGAIWSSLGSMTTSSPTSGSFSWLVSGLPTTHARVRVSLASSPLVTDVSDVDFTLTGPTMTVTSPNGAGVVFIGSSRPISFTHNLGTGQSILVDVSRDGGATWTNLGSMTTTSSPSGTFNWTATGPATTQARVRVRWASTPSVFDVSDVNFTLRDRPGD